MGELFEFNFVVECLDESFGGKYRYVLMRGKVSYGGYSEIIVWF